MDALLAAIDAVEFDPRGHLLRQFWHGIACINPNCPTAQNCDMFKALELHMDACKGCNNPTCTKVKEANAHYFHCQHPRYCKTCAPLRGLPNKIPIPISTVMVTRYKRSRDIDMVFMLNGKLTVLPLIATSPVLIAAGDPGYFARFAITDGNPSFKVIVDGQHFDFPTNPLPFSLFYRK